MLNSNCGAKLDGEHDASNGDKCDSDGFLAKEVHFEGLDLPRCLSVSDQGLCVYFPLTLSSNIGLSGRQPVAWILLFLRVSDHF